MPISLEETGVRWKDGSLRWADFTERVLAFLAAFGPRNRTLTEDLEREGMRLNQSSFPPGDTARWIREVYQWGGCVRWLGQLIDDDRIESVCRALRDAAGAMPADNGRGGFRRADANALARLNRVHGWGRASMASKMLRMLRPDRVGVLDGVVQQHCEYEDSPEGFASFAGHCRQAAAQLEARHVPNPRHRPEGSWFAADVECAIYSTLQGFKA